MMAREPGCSPGEYDLLQTFRNNLTLEKMKLSDLRKRRPALTPSGKKLLSQRVSDSKKEIEKLQKGIGKLETKCFGRNGGR